jgi:Domain of unknown function (DUF3601)
MNQAHRKILFVILSLLICLGSGAVALAFWLIDRPQVISNSGFILAISFVVFFLSYTGAFLLYLRWRDSRRGMSKTSIPSTALAAQDLEGTIYGMLPGSQYKVIQSFTDYYGNSFEQREVLRFKQRFFLPYEGGHTIVFEERSLYLQEEKNQEIVDHFSEYFVQIGQ